MAKPGQETRENDFLDLVDGNNNVLVQGRGVDDVSAKARSQGLTFPALGYGSPEGHCFVKRPPATATACSNAEPTWSIEAVNRQRRWIERRELGRWRSTFQSVALIQHQRLIGVVFQTEV